MADETRNRENSFPAGASVDLDQLERDPYPDYAMLRETEPVSYVAALGMYFVTRYDDVSAVLRDDEHYVVGTQDSVVFDIFGKHMMTVDGTEHDRFKGTHQKFFLPPSVRASLEPGIGSHADTLIDGFEAQGEVELRGAFASRLPVLTMLSLFGMDFDEEPQFRRLYDVFERALANFTWDEDIRQQGKLSAAEFHELVGGYLQRIRASEGREDASLLATLVRAPTEQRLTDEEISHNAIIIFFGGISTVDALILNTLYALSRHPDALEQVRRDIALLPKAITETIRWLGPVQSATRHVVRRTELNGVVFEPGDTVNCMLAAANHDPAMFPAPDVFDLHRHNAQRHIGFAVGPHHCLGSHLARAEARIALERLFARLPNLRLDLARVDGPRGYEFRQPGSAIATWG
jgi:cytochrome P450